MIDKFSKCSKVRLYYLAFTWSTIHWTPSLSPSPVMALHPNMLQSLSSIISSCNCSTISSGSSAVIRSCLLAKKSNGIPASSSSSNKVCNSSKHSSSRLFICSVNNVHENVSLLIVVLPVFSDCFLTSNVPDVDFKSWRIEGFDVETLRRHDEVDFFSHNFL